MLGYYYYYFFSFQVLFRFFQRGHKKQKNLFMSVHHLCHWCLCNIIPSPLYVEKCGKNGSGGHFYVSFLFFQFLFSKEKLIQTWSKSAVNWILYIYLVEGWPFFFQPMFFFFPCLFPFSPDPRCTINFNQTCHSWSSSLISIHYWRFTPISNQSTPQEFNAFYYECQQLSDARNWKGLS